MITVNNFFGHPVKEISITRYGHDRQLISTFSPFEIYQYSDAMLKHQPKDSLKKIEKTLLYSKRPVYFNKTTIDRTIHNGTGATRANDAKDFDERITKFRNQLKNEYVYRVPLRYFADLRKIDFPLKIGSRTKSHLETDPKKLFESRKVLAATAGIPSSDTKIIFTKAPFIK